MANQFFFLFWIFISFAHAEEIENLDLFSLQEGDIYFGRSDAPITMIEYDSLSCLHCAHFHENILPDIKEKYIDKGYVMLILRDFPIDPAAFYASMLCHCYSQGDAIKFEHLKSALFRHQRNWLKAEYKDSLNDIVKLAGMNEEEINNCANNADLKNKIAKSRLDAIIHLNVDATPTFFINKKAIIGLSSFEYFDNIFKKILQDKSNPG